MSHRSIAETRVARMGRAEYFHEITSMSFDLRTAQICPTVGFPGLANNVTKGAAGVRQVTCTYLLFRSTNVFAARTVRDSPEGNL